MSRAQLALGVVLGALATAALVALSDVGVVLETSDDAVIRLSWRAVGERIERCRVPSEEELAALPLHMRQKEICEGTLAPFRLDVAIDGRVAHSAEIRAAGAREDRPTYVFEEFRVAPGRHALHVRFALAEDGEAKAAGRAPLVLETTIEAGPRAVVLVTRDAESDALVVRGAEG